MLLMNFNQRGRKGGKHEPGNRTRTDHILPGPRIKYPVHICSHVLLFTPSTFVSFHNNQSVTPIYLYYRSQFLQFVNFRITFAKTTFHLQQTPLHVAASQGHCYIVEYFVQQGAHVSIKDNDGASVNILLVILVISID